VQRGHHDLRGGNFFAVDIHVVDRDAAAVIDNSDGVIEMNRDVDFVSVSGESFVDRIVDDFIDEVMKAEFAGRANVHGGTFAHRLHATENLDRIGGVVGVIAVFIFGVRDGGRNFFRGHSAP